MYEKVDSSLDFVAREKRVSEFWKENDIFLSVFEQGIKGDGRFGRPAIFLGDEDVFTR